MSQTLAVGKTPQASFKGLPGRTGQSLKPLSDVSMFLAGPPAAGKTTLLSTIPDSFLINLDGSSISHPAACAQVWPDSEAHNSLTWDDVIKVKETLVNMAKTNQPRPKVVALDSVAGALSLLIDWTVANARTLGLSQSDVKSWRQLNGKAAWDNVYGELAKFYDALRQSGYSVIFTGHIINKVIPLGEDKSIYKPDFTFGPGLWSRLHWRFEMVPIINIVYGVKKETTYIQTPQRDGSVKQTPRVSDVTVKEHHILFNDPAYAEVAKVRVPVQNVNLDWDNPWACFENAYNEAAQSLKANPATKDTTAPVAPSPSTK